MSWEESLQACQEGHDVLSDAVESPARGFPVDTCSGTRQLQSHQSQANCPQPAKQEVKQVESSARRQVHMHKKGKNTPEGKEGSSVCLPPETCMSLETKPSQELLFHAAV